MTDRICKRRFDEVNELEECFGIIQKNVNQTDSTRRKFIKPSHEFNFSAGFYNVFFRNKWASQQHNKFLNKTSL